MLEKDKATQWERRHLSHGWIRKKKWPLYSVPHLLDGTSQEIVFCYHATLACMRTACATPGATTTSSCRDRDMLLMFHDHQWGGKNGQHTRQNLNQNNWLITFYIFFYCASFLLLPYSCQTVNNRMVAAPIAFFVCWFVHCCVMSNPCKQDQRSVDSNIYHALLVKDLFNWIEVCIIINADWYSCSTCVITVINCM